ncbi:hypothetical protein H7171_03230 [Candidatus Saccharibacteria bacterium]|nr:hypothetical protein [Candidatus Saccharibacteria bacterium]
MTLINDQEIEITAVYFRARNQQPLESYPRQIVYKGREYTFAEAGIRYLVKKGQEFIRLIDLSDGNDTFRLRCDDNRWTLVGMRAGV